MAVIRFNPRERNLRHPLLPLSAAADLPGGAAPYFTDVLEIGPFPLSSLGVLVGAGATTTIDIYVSNVGVAETTTAKRIATDVAANDVVKLDQGAAFVFAHVKTLTGGKIQLDWAGTPQS